MKREFAVSLSPGEAGSILGRYVAEKYDLEDTVGAFIRLDIDLETKTVLDIEVVVTCDEKKPRLRVMRGGKSDG